MRSSDTANGAEAEKNDARRRDRRSRLKPGDALIDKRHHPNGQVKGRGRCVRRRFHSAHAGLEAFVSPLKRLLDWCVMPAGAAAIRVRRQAVAVPPDMVCNCDHRALL